MRFLVMTLSIAFALALISTAFSAQFNLLQNPGFEEGDFPPAGWSDWSGSETGVPEDGVAGFPVDKQNARTGNKAAGKIFYGRKARWGGFSQTVSCKGGGYFSASGYVRNKQGDVALGGGQAFVELKFLDETGLELKKIASSLIKGPCSWKQLTVSGSAPYRAKSVVFSFVVTGGAGAHGKVFFDDAFLSINQ